MKFETADTRYGLMVFPENDAVLGPSLKLYGEWAQDEIDGLAQLIKNGDIVIDAGANIGTHTLGFAHAVAPNGRVYAFEPQPGIYEMLQRNCSINAKSATIVTYCKPLSDVSNQQYLLPVFDENKIQNFGAAQLSSAINGENQAFHSNSSMTIDDLKLDACRLLKLDVEGMELEVLNGAINLIKKCQPLIFFEANTIPAAWEIIQKFTSLNKYSSRVVVSDAFSACNFNQNKLNIFSDYQETSILLYPAEEEKSVAAAFKNSIYVSNLTELTVALAFCCRRPPGHPLADTVLCCDFLENSGNFCFDILARNILNELIHQREVKQALNLEQEAIRQDLAVARQDLAVARQDLAVARQDLAVARQDNQAIAYQLRKYQMFPPIRALRKFRHIYAAFTSWLSK
jgi:FkbM family methyltransferase